MMRLGAPRSNRFSRVAKTGDFPEEVTPGPTNPTPSLKGTPPPMNANQRRQARRSTTPFPGSAMLLQAHLSLIAEYTTLRTRVSEYMVEHQAAMDDLRLSVQYLVFDAEATTRERDAARQEAEKHKQTAEDYGIRLRKSHEDNDTFADFLEEKGLREEFLQWSSKQRPGEQP